MTSEDIKYQAEAFMAISDHITFWMWCQSKGFWDEDAEKIRTEVMRFRKEEK
jgi:hypothetical protein